MPCLTLGQTTAENPDELFNMTYFALRTCAAANGISRLHGQVSQQLFHRDINASRLFMMVLLQSAVVNVLCSCAHFLKPKRERRLGVFGYRRVGVV